MSTDAEAEREAVAQENAAAPDDRDDGGGDTRVLPRWTVPIGVITVIATAVVVGRFFGVGPAILVLAATALLVVVGFLFRAVQSAAEPDDEQEVRDALPPTLAEEQKRAALRALKELEFEKSVGNISPEDYEIIVARYREEAKRAMREVDEERKTMRERAEKIAKKALRAELPDTNESAAPDAEKENEPPPAPAKAYREAAAEQPDEAERAGIECTKCSMLNDDDARFCKRCGAAMGDVG